MFAMMKVLMFLGRRFVDFLFGISYVDGLLLLRLNGEERHALPPVCGSGSGSIHALGSTAGQAERAFLVEFFVLSIFLFLVF